MAYQIDSVSKGISAINQTISDPQYFNDMWGVSDCVVTEVSSNPPPVPTPSPSDLFNVDVFVVGLLGALGSDSNVLQYYAVIKDLATFKNFSSMKTMVAGLLGAGKLTQGEVDSLNTVLAVQNIVLSNF